jgi:hypothetical protein
MEPPPSYHEIITSLNKSRKQEMMLTEEIKELKKEIENLKIENELNKDAKHMYYNAYIE